MNNNYYCTYRFFNEKHRRLSAFARELDGKIEVVLWECDRHDAFTKSYARGMYENYLETGNFCYKKKVREKVPGKTVINWIEECAKPEIIFLERGDRHLKEVFLDHMESTYLKAYPVLKQIGWRYLDKDARDYVNGLIGEEEYFGAKEGGIEI